MSITRGCTVSRGRVSTTTSQGHSIGKSTSVSEGVFHSTDDVITDGADHFTIRRPPTSPQRTPIVEQYAEIRARHLELQGGEAGPAPFYPKVAT